MPTRTARRPGSRSGSVAVEFALLLPILVSLVSGVVDYGWYLSREAEVVECARDAARAGVSAGGDATVAEARARQALTYIGLDGSGATVTVATAVDTTLHEEVMTVTVSVPHTAPVGLVPSPSVLAGRVAMLVAS